jgi:hypothetical protein
VASTTAQDRRDALVERLFGATIGALELFGVYLGDRLGLYAALAAADALDSDELAGRAGIAPRYAREWLEQQAVAGIIDVEDAEGGTRRFRLPAEHAEVLIDAVSSNYLAPFALLLAGIGGVLPDVVDAYRTGGGVPFSKYGADLRDGQAAMNRPAFTNEMASWVATMPDVDTRLRSEPAARVPTSAVASAGPRSRLPAPSRRRRSRGSTSTRHRSMTRGATPPTPGWPAR